jgi:hypothetical protein
VGERSKHGLPSSADTSVSAQRPPQSLLDLSRDLLRHEAEKAGSADDLASGFQPVCRALHDRLSPLISSLGFQTLFARAITLAARDFPFLANVRLAPDRDCALLGLAEPLEARKLPDGLTLVLAHFIWLLVIFIGENLGFRKVREVWPELPFGPIHSVPGAEE